jgi:hypothetical protein
MALLAEVRAFLQQETASHCVGAIAEAPGDGISRWPYPYTTGYGCSNSLSMKRFHEVWAGNGHECSLKSSIGKASRVPAAGLRATLHGCASPFL